MKRKVVLSGGKTCIVSLPKQWVDKNNINKGDMVEVQDFKTHLQIHPPNTTPPRHTIDIDLTDTAPITRRIIAALYKAGYDEIRVSFSTPEELASIQEVVRQGFVGFELVHQGKQSVMIKSVSKLDPEEYPTVLRRITHLINLNAEESLSAACTQDSNWLETIASRDADVNKLTDFCRRILSISSRTLRTQQRYVLIEMMEKISDCFHDYCNHAKNLPPEKPLLELHSRVNTVLRDTLSLIQEFSVHKLTSVTAANKTTKMQAHSIATHLSGEQVILWSHLNTTLEYLHSMIGALAGANL